jgi:hypothetical protein
VSLRERRGEPDRGLTAAAPLRYWLHGDARQPGRQDVLVAPLSAIHVEVVENQAVRAAVVVRPPTRARRRRRVRACSDPGATLDDLREAVTTLEDAERTARRVLGSAHPLTQSIERALQIGRVVLAARETPPGSSKGSN